MVHSTQHILNNLLNELTIVQLEIDKTPAFDRRVAAKFTQMKSQAQERVEKLSSVSSIEADDIRKSVYPR